MNRRELFQLLGVASISTLILSLIDFDNIEDEVQSIDTSLVDSERPDLFDGIEGACIGGTAKADIELRRRVGALIEGILPGDSIRGEIVRQVGGNSAFESDIAWLWQ